MNSCSNSGITEIAISVQILRSKLRSLYFNKIYYYSRKNDAWSRGTLSVSFFLPVFDIFFSRAYIVFTAWLLLLVIQVNRSNKKRFAKNIFLVQALFFSLALDLSHFISADITEAAQSILRKTGLEIEFATGIGIDSSMYGSIIPRVVLLGLFKGLI